MGRQPWTLEKSLGKMDKPHRDCKRQYVLNYKHMNKLNKSNKSNKDYEEYLYDAPPWTQFLRALLFWRWHLTVLAPAGKYPRWQYILTKRHGKVRELIIRR